MKKSDVEDLFSEEYDEFVNKIEKKLDTFLPSHELYRLNYMHRGTELKLFAMEYHFLNLIKVFKETNSGSAEGQNKIRTEFDAILYSGKCVLDKLSQESKIIMGYQDADYIIDFDKVSQKNDDVGKLFSKIKGLKWYRVFNDYRNTATHRNIPIFSLSLQIGGYSDPYKLVFEDSFEIIPKEYFLEEWKNLSNIFIRSDGTGLSYHLRENPSDLSAYYPPEETQIELVSFSLLSKLLISKIVEQTYKVFQREISKVVQEEINRKN